MNNELLKELIPLVSHYGLWIVFFGMIVEGTAMIIISGMFCYMGILSLNETILVAIFGAISGDQLYYFIGKYFSNNIFSRFPFLKQKSENMKPIIKKKGAWLAFGSRFVYGGAILFPVALGSYNYLHKKFTFFDTLGVITWSVLGILLGHILGTSAEHFFGKIEDIGHFLLLLFIAYIFIKIFQHYTFKQT